MTEHDSETISAFFQLSSDDNKMMPVKTKINVDRVKPKLSINQTKAMASSSNASRFSIISLPPNKP